jgi:hypothetical protein
MATVIAVCTVLVVIRICLFQDAIRHKPQRSAVEDRLESSFVTLVYAYCDILAVQTVVLQHRWH